MTKHVPVIKTLTKKYGLTKKFVVKEAVSMFAEAVLNDDKFREQTLILALRK